MRTMRTALFAAALLAALTPAQIASAFVLPPPPPPPAAAGAAGSSGFGAAGYAAVGIIVVAGGLALFHPNKGLFPRLLKGTLVCQPDDDRPHCDIWVKQHSGRR